jgi:DNA transposition AAA+ family ATPase
MNNSPPLVIDIGDQRDWLNAHKADTGLSWSDLQNRTGISTALSAFAVDKYQGNNQKIAEDIYRYRQLLVQQASVEITAPDLPPFFETPTSRRIATMLSMAQRGRITLVAGGPGNSKTQTIRHYQTSVSQVWVATMAPSTAGVTTMAIEVLDALGETDAKGTPQALSRRIKDRVRNSGGLIVIDEAQHLTEKALEEIRSWHDVTGIGICLVGNEDVLTRLEHGSRKHAFARLASRVSQRLIFHVATEADAAALADAWGVEHAKCRSYITSIALKPGSLRNCTMMLETASMLAAGENAPLQLGHLQDAWSMLSTRQLSL